MMNISRGEIWLAHLDPTIGSEIRKTRPVVVASNNVNNANSSLISVLPVTSNVSKVFSFEVLLVKGIANLPKDSKVKADQIRTLDKSRLVKLIGVVPNAEMIKIATAMKLHLEL